MMLKRILLLTFFYPPDLAAGSFRACALVEALQQAGGQKLQIDVLTTQPNRYHQHSAKTSSIEDSEGLWVRRISLPSRQSGFLGQAISFIRYARKASRLASESEYSMVVATSSRLMTAALGAWIAYRQGAKLYLDIRDIFVENLGGLFGPTISKPLSTLFGMLERWTIERADRVNLVSSGFLSYFQPKYPNQQFSLYPNGVDSHFLEFQNNAKALKVSDRPLQILYAGNVGDGQGLHLIVPELAAQLKGRVSFRVVGSGGRLEALRAAVLARGLDNVELVGPVARHQLISMYHEADVLFLHLNNFKAFERVLPSKLFEYAATGKPLWAGVSGHAAEFIKREICNAAVFPPCDAERALSCFDGLSMKCLDRSDFVGRYARGPIMGDMAQDILLLLE